MLVFAIPGNVARFADPDTKDNMDPIESPAAPEVQEAPAEGSTPQVTPEEKPQEKPQVADADAAAEKAEAIARFRAKVKVDGEEFEVDETELVANYQRSKASMKRFEEAKKLREEAEAEKARVQELFEKFKKDPKNVLRDPTLGLNARELAEQILMEEIEAEMLDPKDRKLREMEAQLEAIKREREEREAAEEAARREATEQQEVQKWIKVYQEEFPRALSAAGLPIDERHVLALKDALVSDLERGLDTPLEALAREVKETLRAQQRDAVAGLDPELLYDFLGPEGFKRLSEFASKKYRPEPVKSTAAPSEAQEAPKKPETKEERIARMARLIAQQK